MPALGLPYRPARREAKPQGGIRRTVVYVRIYVKFMYNVGNTRSLSQLGRHFPALPVFRVIGRSQVRFLPRSPRGPPGDSVFWNCGRFPSRNSHGYGQVPVNEPLQCERLATLHYSLGVPKPKCLYLG
jgi:hypothetical protein